MLATPAPIFSTHSRNSPLSPVEDLLSRKRSHEPNRAMKKIGIGELHAGVFLARHGMASQKTARGLLAKGFLSPA